MALPTIAAVLSFWLNPGPLTNDLPPISGMPAQDQAEQTRHHPDPAITAEQLRQNLKYLSGDDFRGRMTGEHGARLAARWIESRLHRLGLEPIGDSFIHPFAASPLALDQANTNLTLTFASGLGESPDPTNRDYPHSDDFIPHPSGPGGEASGEIVFAGYGIAAPEFEYDDLWGLDFTGKIALVLRWEPQADNRESRFDGKRMLPQARLAAKVRALQLRGAVAVLVADPPGVMHAQIDAAGSPFWPSTSSLYNHLVPLLGIQADRAELSATNFTPRGVADQIFCMLQNQAPLATDIPVAYISRRVLDHVFAATGRNALAWVKETDASGSGSGFATKVDADLTVVILPAKRVGWNLVAVLPGSDPDLKDEYIVIGAHYDHVGANEEGDIWNGADDNASGTVAALALAESFVIASERPRRSLAFAFFSGEEIGLLGASKFLTQGIIKPHAIAAMLNLDMIGRALNKMVHVVGSKSSPLMPTIAARSAEGLDLRFDTEHEEFFDRSDQAVFYYAGIPVLFLNTDEHIDYHTPNDIWSNIEYHSLEQITLMARRAAGMLADLRERPAFVDGYSRLTPLFGRPPQLLVPWPVPFHERLDY